MQRFNLNKFYTINWLLWTSLIGNIIVLFANWYKLKTLTHNFTVYKDYAWIVFYTEITFSFLLIAFLFIIFISLIELILRNKRKISKYNELKMPKSLRIILSNLAILLICIDVYVFYTAFTIVENVFYH